MKQTCFGAPSGTALMGLAVIACWAAGCGRTLDAEPAFVTNSLGLRFARIPAGTFVTSDYEAELCEEPAGPIVITVTKSFYMCTTEVTPAVYMKLMGHSISENPSAVVGDDLPVEGMSCRNAMDFCMSLSRHDGYAYRLPTEAEWELAARAGRRDRWLCGSDPSRLSDFAWFAANTRPARQKDGVPYGPTPVGQKRPNAYGLLDVHGNVSELCLDWYDYLPHHRQTDPRGPLWGTHRVARGGNTGSAARECSFIARIPVPLKGIGGVGMRVVREAGEQRRDAAPLEGGLFPSPDDGEAPDRQHPRTRVQ